MTAAETKLIDVNPAPSSSSSPDPSTINGCDASGDHEEYIFKSKLPDISISNHLPLHSYLFDEKPHDFDFDRPCLISSSKIYTYSETHLLCRKTGAGFHKLGIKNGDVIMILLLNSPEFVFTFLGASMIGAVSTTANPFYTAGEISKQLELAKPKLVVTEPQVVEKLSLDNDVTVVIVSDTDVVVPENCIRFSELWNDEEEEVKLPEVEIQPDWPVALPFSSGTTGLPKGVVLTHRSLTTSVAQQVDGENPNLYLTPNDVLLCVLPLFHIFSLNSVLMAGLRAGSAILIMAKFEIATLLELIQKHRVTVAMVVPPLVLALAKNPLVHKYDISSIRILLSGAAPLGRDLEDALRPRIPNAILGQGYGMTEAGPVLSMCPAFAKDPCPTKPGSCGVVVRNAEMKIIDPDTGLSLNYNQPGEICIRGQQIMKGYLNDPAATSATIDAQGWLHTGDIGFVDHDHEVFIVDRVKEIIKYKGFQVAPAELEALLVNHPSIADAAVVSKKDEVVGEVPVAFVVRSNLNVTEDEVKEYIAKQVIFYKKLHNVYFINAIPKSPSGKILRRELRTRPELSLIMHD